MTPQEAYYKAKKSGLRIPKLELAISKNVFHSYYYAINVIKGKFILGEPLISKNTAYSYWYAKIVIKGKFILGEPAINKNAEYSCWYAKYVIKGKLPDFMHNQMILENNEYTKEYVKFIQ